MELPPVRNQMDMMYIDGTPRGYALRILRAYRNQCDEKWIVSGIDEKRALVYDLMNKHQDERAKELDKAIDFLLTCGMD